MIKTALMFAGQGAQSVGMGRDLAEAFPSARAWFERANEALGYDLTRVCFEGPDADLTRTENAQPGIYLVGWVAWSLLQERLPDLGFEAAAGLSLGEFTALSAAGVLGFEDGLRVTRARGRFMQDACEATRGGMAAILNLDEAVTREICEATGVELANLNCPGQLVISGPEAGLAAACDQARARGARRAVPLPVAGAYHSRLMAGAQPRLAGELAGLELQPSSVPVVSNVTARPHGDPQSIRDVLVRQVCAPVRWEESIRWLGDQGFTRFIELGPGKALSGFLKRILPEAECLRVSDVPSLEATVAACSAPAS
ncbi:MAG: ACP S-malonyltransferase [Verrucomicrobiae bacterium]|nr:ACP S-malonyltransferase [Verrucomicrobiae bacterium]